MIAALVFTSPGLISFPGENSPLAECRLLLIIEESFINCPACVESLSFFLDLIRNRRLEDSILGVYTLQAREHESKSEKYFLIKEKQLQGFTLGHSIGFPILLDRAGHFAPLARDGTCVVFFDAKMHQISKYKFPLNTGQAEGILLNLQGRKKSSNP